MLKTPKAILAKTKWETIGGDGYESRKNKIDNYMGDLSS